MPTDEFDVFELTKIGVKKSFRNQGVGRLLINKCIEKVKLDKLKKVIIYSNRKLDKDITLYSFRHTGAIEIFKRTGSIHKLQRAMGHSSLNVSLTYLRGLEVAELKEEDMPMV